MTIIKAYAGSSDYIFVSYAHKDRDVVTPVIAYLQRRGYNVWFDEGITPGRDWAETLGARIRDCACILCFISPRWTASAECAKEALYALDLDKSMVNVFLEPTTIPANMADGLLRVQGIERFRMGSDAEFYIKLLEHGLFDTCHDTEEFQIIDGNLVRYNGDATAVVIPDNVTQVGYNAFEGCKDLQWVRIPATVNRLGKFAFNDTPSLTEFEVAPENGFFLSIDGVLYNKAANYLLCYPSARPTESYEIPAGVKHIGMVAFNQANLLSNISMPDSVGHIGDRAFEACRNLVDIRLSNTITKIRPYTFSRCSSLVSCALPAQLEELGDGAFSGCSSLEAIKLPETLQRLGEMAFAHCGALREITLPTGIQSVPEYCFHECTSLEFIDLAGVREVQQYAFKNCESLVSAKFSNLLEEVGRAAFSGCTALRSLHIPGSVRTIGEYAFDRCPNLEEVVIEDGVERILEGAFDKDFALRRVVLPASIVDVHPKAFPAETELVRAR